MHSDNDTVAAVLERYPAGARVLDRHQIDYCCGGKQTFREACTRAGVEPAALLEELSSASSGTALPDWTTLPLDELCDAIERIFHRPMDVELPRLEHLVRKVRDVHGARHPELAEIHRIYAALQEELVLHMAKEERVLFPMIRRAGAAPPPPIGVMMHEHEEVGAALAAMRQLTRGYDPPPDACTSYRALYAGLEELEHVLHVHIHVENNILFPRAQSAQ
jgi:regulator of cell morphogenesis and NO signaling